MSTKSQTLFIGVFLLLIFCVGAVQAVYEKKRGESIQMLDLFVDTFVTPSTRVTVLADLLDKLAGKLGDVEKETANGAGENESWESAAAQARAEEALFLVQDIRRNALSLNRYINADTADAAFRCFDTLRSHWDNLYEMTMDEDLDGVRKALGPVRSYTQKIQKRYRRPGVAGSLVLAWNAFWTQTAFSQHYLRAWEKEMEKTSIAANTLRPPMQFFRYMAMHDLGDKAVLGRKGWFFYRPGFDYLTFPHVRNSRCLPDTTTNIQSESAILMKDNPIACITNFKDQLARRGIDLLVVVIPGKSSVYPDMINAGLTANDACSFSHSVKIIKTLREKGVDVVDLFGPFARERLQDGDAGDSLYLQRDTHWKARGLKLAAKLVAERVRKYPWYDTSWETTEYVVDSLTVDRMGDVGTMTALPEFHVRELGMRFPAEPTRCYQVSSVVRDSSGVEIARRKYRDDFSRSKILILGDSFSRIYQTDAPRSAGWIAHFAKNISQPVASIVSDGGASTLVREKLARKASVLRGKKLVVWEFIERDLRFGAEGWKDITFDF